MVVVGYPDECKTNVEAVSDALNIDGDTAYALISLYAVLMDLSTSDVKVVQMIFEDNGKPVPDAVVA